MSPACLRACGHASVSAALVLAGLASLEAMRSVEGLLAALSLCSTCSGAGLWLAAMSVEGRR